ncbi:MAG: transposase [Gammaproteobacteria bacterium]|nr:transposase [Gammaproteobacteria bacterium]
MRNENLFSLLSRLDDDIFSVLKKIRTLTDDEHITDTDKVKKIRSLLKDGKDDELAGLKVGLESELSEGDYFEVLEARSLRLQNRVSPILKALCFQAEPGAAELMEAIEHFKASGGAITPAAPLDFLEPQEHEAVIARDGKKFRTSLYKAFLFMHTANAIKSGNLNLEQSYKHRPLDDYLISKDRWSRKREKLLEQVDLSDLADPKKVMRGLDKVIFEQYQTTNANAVAGNNPHLKILTNGQFRIATPALEGEDSDPLQPLFPERHYVPLTEVLAIVNRHCGFLEELQHWQQRHIHSTVSHRALFAGVMALGCGIGIHKMGRISSQITENELVHAVNWYFSLDNIQAANDRVVKDMEEMELPKIYQKSEDKLHTASDGQKFEVRTDSLNANYSLSLSPAKMQTSRNGK